jgi:hypothetical protein
VLYGVVENLSGLKPVIMDNMKKRRFYDTAVKKKIILYAEEHGNRAAGRAFDIPESCI